MLSRKILATIFLLKIAALAAQLPPVLVNENFEWAHITPASYRDLTALDGIEEMGKPYLIGKFVPCETPFFSFGDDPANYWFLFKIKNKQSIPRSLFLKLNRKNFDAFQLWQRDSLGKFTAFPEVGATIPIKREYWLMDCFYNEIVLPANQETVFICRASNRVGSMHLGMSLHTEEHFRFENRRSLTFFGLFLGVMVLTIFFSFGLWVQYGNRIYLFYLLYVLNILLRETYNFSADFGIFPMLQRYGVSILLAASFGTFYRHFLRLWDLSPALDRLVFWYVRGVLVVSGLILALALFNDFILSNSLLRTLNITNLFFTALALGVAFYFRKNNFQAQVLMIAYLPLAVGFALILLRNLNLIGNFPIIQHIVMFGFVFEVLIFTCVFSFWYKKLDRRTERLRHQLAEEELIRQLAIQKAEQTVKDRIARDLHDDVSATVSGIRILSQVAKKQVAATNPGTLPLLEQITDSAKSASEGISDLIWAVKPTSDSLNDLADRIRDHASKILDAAEVDYLFDIPRDLPELILDIETKRNLFLIFKEALNNSLKYSHARSISVGLNFENQILKMAISDNGEGFDVASNLPKGSGNGLKNMQKRAADVGARLEISSAAGFGTSVFLELPLRV